MPYIKEGNYPIIFKKRPAGMRAKLLNDEKADERKSSTLSTTKQWRNRV